MFKDLRAISFTCKETAVLECQGSEMCCFDLSQVTVMIKVLDNINNILREYVFEDSFL